MRIDARDAVSARATKTKKKNAIHGHEGKKLGTAPPTRGAVRRVIGFATYLLHVHDAASRREVVRGDVPLDPALDFEESSLRRARVGVKRVSVASASGCVPRVRTGESGALVRSRIWRGAADPLTLRRLSSSASAEEGILKGPPFIVMRDRECAQKCGSRRGSLRGRKCAGGAQGAHEKANEMSGCRSGRTFLD